MQKQPLWLVLVAALVMGCGPSERVTTEILDKGISAVVPEKKDSTVLPWFDKYLQPTEPAFRLEGPNYGISWTPTPTIPDALRDTLVAVRGQLSRVLSKLNALQGHIGKLTVTRKPDSVEVRYRDTTRTTVPPVVIETSWIEKIGIAAVGAVVALLLAGAAVLILPKLK